MVVKVIKQDALVNVQLGTAFMQKLQGLLMYIAEDLSDEQLSEYKSLTEKGEDYPEDWMTHLYTLSVLLKEIEDQAEKQGFVVDTDVDTINQEDN